MKKNDFTIKQKKKEIENMRMQVDNFDPLFITKEKELINNKSEMEELMNKY